MLGQYVKVNNFMFQVVGIYKDDEDEQATAFSAYSAIKSIYGANTDDAGNIEFTFHGLNTEKANEDFEEGYRRRINANHQVHPEDECCLAVEPLYAEPPDAAGYRYYPDGIVDRGIIHLAERYRGCVEHHADYRQGAHP